MIINKDELLFEDLYLKIKTETFENTQSMLFEIYHTDEPDVRIAHGKMNWQGIISLHMTDMYVGDIEYMICFTKAINRLYKYAESIGFSHIEVNDKLEEL